MEAVSGMTERPWAGFFDPADKRLYAYDSDVDWWRASHMATLEKPVKVAARDGNEWMMPYWKVAEAMVRAQPETVDAIISSLFAWRTATVSQLRAGLCDMPLPAFNRHEPGLWGALNRLGIINVGFSRRERIEGITLPQVWVGVGDDAKLVRHVLDYIGQGRPWLAQVMTSTLWRAMHTHARHNTFAAHVGLTACRDTRVRLTAGDGWGAFRLIDPQATRESGSHAAAGMDTVMLTRDNVLAGIEVQTTASETFMRKLERWARFLAFSPMPRRGMLCVWLFVQSRAADASPNFLPVVRALAGMPEMTAGDPDVASRMGWATWEEWYDHGTPTEHWGEYTDMRGNRRSIFDPMWRECTPRHVNGVKAAQDWGWRFMRDEMLRIYGWDMSGWAFPQDMRGGFHGFTPHVAQPGETDMPEAAV